MRTVETTTTATATTAAKAAANAAKAACATASAATNTAAVSVKVDAPARHPGRGSRASRADSAGALLRTLLREGPSPRSTLARLSGLSPASVTGHSSDLIDRGLVAELPGTAPPAGIGRPHVPLDLAPGALVGGLHVALAETTAAILDLRGRVVAERRFPHAGAPAEDVLTQAADALHALAAAYAGGSGAGSGGGSGLRSSGLLGVGLATGGWVDRDAGTVAEHSLLGWRDVPAAAIVRRRLADLDRGAVADAAATSGPTPVHVDSHTRALIRAEQLFGGLDPRHTVLALFAGNVVDAAFALGDRVNRGPRSGAGDIAHWPVPGSRHVCECGRSGCLQSALSELRLVEEGIAAGIIEAPDEAANPDDPSDPVDALLRAAESGNTAARDLFTARSDLAGRALAPLADFLNPDVVLVVDRGTARFGQAHAALLAALAGHSSVGGGRRPSVIVSSFMRSPLATAAGTVALDVLYRDPLAVAVLPRRSAP